jgi:tyrosine-specific transport protein
VNRVLMLVKVSAFVALMVFITPHISIPQLHGGQLKLLSGSITVAITSFGFATIIPSLRTYFHGDIKKLRFVILIGSLIPLICYILWDMAIIGVIPREGNHGLINMLQSGRSISEFVNELSAILQRDTITTSARIFTSICLLTSFLGVALCLTDFLADGFRLDKNAEDKLTLSLMTLIPPLLIVIFFPGIFIKALSYAGICCVILLMLLPAIMAWRGRYHKNFASAYQVPGGKVLLIFIILVSLLILVQSVVDLLR